MSILLSWDQFPQHDRTHILELYHLKWILCEAGSAACLQACLWSPLETPGGQQKTFISMPVRLLTADLHRLSPTAEAQVRTRFRLLINPSRRNNKVCSHKQTRTKISWKLLSFLSCACLSDVKQRLKDIAHRSVCN